MRPVTDTLLPDEGAPMTATGLMSVTGFLLACGTHPDDLGEAWAYVRSLEFDAEHPSQMAPLVFALWEYTAARAYDRQRAANGNVGRHTGSIPTA